MFDSLLLYIYIYGYEIEDFSVLLETRSSYRCLKTKNISYSKLKDKFRSVLVLLLSEANSPPSLFLDKTGGKWFYNFFPVLFACVFSRLHLSQLMPIIAHPIELISLFCQSAYTWLKGDILNVVVVHCKAGMARTGLMISSLLLFLKVRFRSQKHEVLFFVFRWKIVIRSGSMCHHFYNIVITLFCFLLQFFPTAEECIEYYNQKRCLDGKGLILPSQIVSQLLWSNLVITLHFLNYFSYFFIFPEICKVLWAPFNILQWCKSTWT